jgi:hypothetical protein
MNKIVAKMVLKKGGKIVGCVTKNSNHGKKLSEVIDIQSDVVITSNFK